jgi:hypothetical protein
MNKFVTDHKQYISKLDEYLSSPSNMDPNQEEADRLRFLFLSHFSNHHQTQEEHDYFQLTLDDENEFEQFF